MTTWIPNRAKGPNSQSFGVLGWRIEFGQAIPWILRAPQI